MTFKPKKQQIHVPGVGVVQKEDFTKEHFATVMKRAGTDKEKKDAFLKQYFEVASYDDMPLFEEGKKEAEADNAEAKPAKERKKKSDKDAV